MDPLTCFLEANPNAIQKGEIMYNGMTIPIFSSASLKTVADTHFVEQFNMFTNIVELGNTGEYIALTI